MAVCRGATARVLAAAGHGARPARRDTDERERLAAGARPSTHLGSCRCSHRSCRRRSATSRCSSSTSRGSCATQTPTPRFRTSGTSRPFCYFSNPHALTGPAAEIAVPPGCADLDFELEVAAIIGRAGRDLRAGRRRARTSPATRSSTTGPRAICSSPRCAWGWGRARERTSRTRSDRGSSRADELEPYRVGDRLHLALRAERNGAVIGSDTLANMAWSFEELDCVRFARHVGSAGRRARLGNLRRRVPARAVGSARPRPASPRLRPGDVVCCTSRRSARSTQHASSRRRAGPAAAGAVAGRMTRDGSRLRARACTSSATGSTPTCSRDGGWGLSNAGLITTPGASLLVDTLFDLRLTAAMLDSMAPLLATSPIRAAFNTHGDPRPLLRQPAACRRDAPIHATSAATPRCEKRRASAVRGMLADDSTSVRSSPRSRESASARSTSTASSSGCRPATFRRTRELHVGDRVVELIEVGPAHSAGDAIAHVPDAAACSRATSSSSPGRRSSGPDRRELARRVRADPPPWAPARSCPGHGPLTDADGRACGRSATCSYVRARGEAALRRRDDRRRGRRRHRPRRVCGPRRSRADRRQRRDVLPRVRSLASRPVRCRSCSREWRAGPRAIEEPNPSSDLRHAVRREKMRSVPAQPPGRCARRASGAAGSPMSACSTRRASCSRRTASRASRCRRWPLAPASPSARSTSASATRKACFASSRPA